MREVIVIVLAVIGLAFSLSAVVGILRMPDVYSRIQCSSKTVTMGTLPALIALVGASDNSGWARLIVASCTATGFAGTLTAVHPRATRAFGLPIVRSLRELPEPADLVFAAQLVVRARARQAQPAASRMMSASTLSAAMPSGQRQLPTSPWSSRKPPGRARVST